MRMLALLAALAAAPARAQVGGCYCYCDLATALPPPCSEQKCIDYCGGGSGQTAPSRDYEAERREAEAAAQAARREAEKKRQREDDERRRREKFQADKAQALGELKGGRVSDVGIKGGAGGGDLGLKGLPAGGSGIKRPRYEVEVEEARPHRDECTSSVAQRCLEAAISQDAALEAERREGAAMIFSAAAIDAELDADKAYDRIIAWGKERFKPLEDPKGEVKDSGAERGPRREAPAAQREREAGEALRGRYDSSRTEIGPREMRGKAQEWRRNARETLDELRQFKRYLDELIACEKVADRKLYQSCTQKVNQLHDALMKKLTSESVIRKLLGEKIAQASGERLGRVQDRVKKAREAYQAWVGRSLDRAQRLSARTARCLGACR